MTAMVLAMIGTLAIGFMAGREYDRGIKRVKANQRRRREEIMRMKKAARARRQVAEDQRKFDYMYSIQFDGPNGKR